MKSSGLVVEILVHWRYLWNVGKILFYVCRIASPSHYTSINCAAYFRRPKMALMKNHCVDIHVTNTTDKDKTILVFGKDHDGYITPEIVHEAWQVLHVRSQRKTMLSYPSSTSIGGFYSREDGTVVNIGPFKAAPGTTCPR